MTNIWSSVKAAWNIIKFRPGPWWHQRWVRLTALGRRHPGRSFSPLPPVITTSSFARLLDARLHGERATVFPQVFARPLELRRGQSLTEAGLIDRLNDLGYTQRTMFEKPGEFVIGSGDVTIIPRGAEFNGKSVRVVFQRPTPAATRGQAGDAVRRPTGCSRSSATRVQPNDSRSTHRSSPRSSTANARSGGPWRSPRFPAA